MHYMYCMWGSLLIKDYSTCICTCIDIEMGVRKSLNTFVYITSSRVIQLHVHIQVNDHVFIKLDILTCNWQT